MTSLVTNPNPVEKQPGIVVSANAGVVDTLTAAGRLAMIVLSVAPAAILVFKKHDLVALYDFFQSQQGVALGGALAGLASMGYGLYKSWKRGAQVATVATSNEVPNSVATTKQEVAANGGH